MSKAKIIATKMLILLLAIRPFGILTDLTQLNLA